MTDLKRPTRIPILENHNQDRPLGWCTEKDGELYIDFGDDVTFEQIEAAFGNASIEIIEKKNGKISKVKIKAFST